MKDVIFQVEPQLDPDEFIEVLKLSTLAERRPVENRMRIESMCRHANLIVTARLDGRLVGVARALTDFTFCTYLSDLAVDSSLQHQGIGKKLIALTKQQVPEGKLILLSAPAAVDYYPKIGMKRHDHCFTLDTELTIS